MGKGDASKTVKNAKGGGAGAKAPAKPTPAPAAKAAKEPEKKGAAKPSKEAEKKAAKPAAAPAKPAKEAAKPAKAEAAKPAAKGAGKPAKAEPEAKPSIKPGAPAAPTTSAEVAGVVRKKKNVKRGAPPMLPRRNLKRDIPPPGSPPPPPRAPMMPGSLHAPARAPEDADQKKKNLSTIHNLLNQLKAMKRSIGRQFFEVGLILTKLSDPNLYKTRNYASFDAFVEREIERDINIGRSEVSALIRIVRLFQQKPAEEIGLERLKAALKVIYPDNPANPAS
jgi:hypothetical protein